LSSSATRTPPARICHLIGHAFDRLILQSHLVSVEDGETLFDRARWDRSEPRDMASAHDANAGLVGAHWTRRGDGRRPVTDVREALTEDLPDGLCRCVDLDLAAELHASNHVRRWMRWWSAHA